MIHVSFSLLILIYLLGLLGLIFGAWLWNVLATRSRQKKSVQHRLRCTTCSLEFSDDSQTPLPRCPRCGNLNERSRFSTL